MEPYHARNSVLSELFTEMEVNLPADLGMTQLYLNRINSHHQSFESNQLMTQLAYQGIESIQLMTQVYYSGNNLNELMIHPRNIRF